MKLKALLLTSLGILLLILGAIGLVLPILPTTPFVLASAACLSSTPRLKAQIMKIKFFKEYIDTYKNRNGLSQKTVLISLTYLWAMLAISIFLVDVPWKIFLFIFIGIAVTIHILWVSRDRTEVILE